MSSFAIAEAVPSVLRAEVTVSATKPIVLLMAAPVTRCASRIESRVACLRWQGCLRSPMFWSDLLLHKRVDYRARHGHRDGKQLAPAGVRLAPISEATAA